MQETPHKDSAHRSELRRGRGRLPQPPAHRGNAPDHHAPVQVAPPGHDARHVGNAGAGGHAGAATADAVRGGGASAGGGGGGRRR